MENRANAIRLVARALQEEKRGEAVIAEMDRQLAEIDAVLSRRTDRRPVALLVSQMTNYGGPGSMYHEIITRARIENGIEKVGLKNGDYLAKELVVKARPDFFFVSSHRANSTESSEKFRDEFLSDQALQGLPALQHIHSVPDRYLYSATQNIPYAVKALANIAYGPVFDMGDEHCIKGY